MRHSGLHKQVTKLEDIVHVCAFPYLQIEVHGRYGGRIIGYSVVLTEFHTSQKQDTNGGNVTHVGVFLPTNRNTWLEVGYVVCLEFQVFPCVQLSLL